MLVEGSLDLFEAPSVFKSFIGCKTIEINPLDGWKNSDVIEFQLPRYSEMLYQPSSFKLEMESHIEPTVDPVPPPPPAAAAPAARRRSGRRRRGSTPGASRPSRVFGSG